MTKAPTRIIVTDHADRRHRMITLTPDMRASLAASGKVIPDNIKQLPARTKTGAIVQDVVRRDTVFEGTILQRALARARRYRKSGKGHAKPPQHIALYLKALEQYEGKAQ